MPVLWAITRTRRGRNGAAVVVVAELGYGRQPEIYARRRDAEVIARGMGAGYQVLPVRVDEVTMPPRPDEAATDARARRRLRR